MENIYLQKLKPELIRRIEDKVLSSGRKLSQGLFRCPYCGKEFKTPIQQVNSGACKSCGCYNIQRIIQRNTSHGLSKTPLYKRWNLMMGRCYGSGYRSQKYYSSRGISVCDEWRDMNNFIQWGSGSGFDDSLELDRIDNDLGYGPKNCRWVTRVENCQNTRRLMSRNSSGYRGVNWDAFTGRWLVRARLNGKAINLGRYHSIRDAVLVYNDFIVKNNMRCPLNPVPEK